MSGMTAHPRGEADCELGDRGWRRHSHASPPFRDLSLLLTACAIVAISSRLRRTIVNLALLLSRSERELGRG